MQKRVLWFSVISIISLAAPALGQDVSARATASNEEKQQYANDYAAAKKLQHALKNNDKQAVADLIAYPLKRTRPLSPIHSPQQFLQHWDEFFDAATVKKILAVAPETVGWRGVALDAAIWFAEGKVTAIHFENDAYKKALTAAITTDSDRLYKTAQHYDNVQFECRTSTHYIRTQHHGKDLRYFAWKKDTALSTIPELELTNGVLEPQGSGGNYTMTFRNNDYTYQIAIGDQLCGETCHNNLTIFKNQQKVATHICQRATY